MLLLATAAVPVAWWVGLAAVCAVGAHGVAMALFVARPRPALGGLEALAAAAALTLLAGAPVVALVLLLLGALVVLGVASAVPGVEAGPGRERPRARVAFLAVGFAACLVAGAVVGVPLAAGVADRTVLPPLASPGSVATLLTHAASEWLAAVGLIIVLLAVVVAATERRAAPVNADDPDDVATRP